MNIILEGVDASGKSTLAASLANALGRKIIASEGPEKEPGEIIQRIQRYSTYRNVIFDRHPVFSHPIYSQGNTWMSDIPQWMINEVRTGPNLIVYCQPTQAGFNAHDAGEHETQEHLDMVRKNYLKFTRDYNQWALDNAHMLYRCGEQFDETLARILFIVRQK